MATAKTVGLVLADFARALPGKFTFPADRPGETNEAVQAANAAERRAIAALWQRQLAPFSDRLVRAAADRLLAESSFAPAPADLVRLCWRLAVAYYPTSGEAWGQIVHELRRGVPPFRAPVFTIDLVESIVTDWGWPLFVDAYTATGARELSILQDRFTKEYDERVRRWNEGLRATGHEWDLADDLVMPIAPQPTGPAQPSAAPRVDPDLERQPGWPDNPGLDELRAYVRSRPVLRQIHEQASREAAQLYDAIYRARAAGDVDAHRRAVKAMRDYASPEATRQWLADFYNRIQPGLAEEMESLRSPKVCPTCKGQQYVRVHFVRGRIPDVVEPHWREVSRNSLGVTYHCPHCTTVAGRRDLATAYGDYAA